MGTCWDVIIGGMFHIVGIIIGVWLSYKFICWQEDRKFKKQIEAIFKSYGYPDDTYRSTRISRGHGKNEH